MRRRVFALLVLLAVASERPARAQEAPAAGDATDTNTPAPPAAAPVAPSAPPAPEAASTATEAPPDRRWWAVGGLAGIYVPLTVWSYFAWYHNVDNLPDFKFGGDGLFEDTTYAGGADKLGHFWVNLALSRSTTQLLRWGGFGKVPSAIVASSLSWAFFFFVEIKDGFYFEFSPGDVLGNTTGALTAVAMELFPRFDELIDFRMQYFPSSRFRPKLAGGNVDVAEDYSGQIFHVALHLGALPGVKGTQAGDYLRFVDLAVGFHADNYRPIPPDGEAWNRKQELFVGLSLNVQGIVDATLHGGWRKAGHGIFEVWQLPYTTLPLGGLSRSPDAPAAKPN